MSFIQIPIGTYPNTFLGYQSSIKITTGVSNTALGVDTLRNTAAGSRNAAFGDGCLIDNVDGDDNSSFGWGAAGRNLTGDQNSAFGNLSLQDNTSGNGNTAIGGASLRRNLGNLNTAVGYNSGFFITTGNKNTILGSYNGNQGGLDIRTLSNYVVLSDGDGNPRLYIDNAGLVTAPGGFAGAGGTLTFNNITGAYTIVASDLGKIVNATSGTFTVLLTAAATLGSGFACFVWNTGTGVITIDPNGAETIDGVSTLILRQGEGTQIVCNGSNWETGSKKTMRAYADNIVNTRTRPVASGTDAIAIGYSSTASGNTGLAIGTFAQATGLYSTAIGSSPLGAIQSSGNESLALGSRTSASSSYAVAMGVNSSGSGSVATGGSSAMALGGSYASGSDSFSAAILNNTSSYGTTQSNAIALGYLSRAQGLYSAAVGFICSSTATRSYAFGDSCTATAVRSFAFGSDALSTLIGKQAYANGAIAAPGDNQAGRTILKNRTTNAAPTALTTDTTAAFVTNQVILANNTAFAFTGTVVARQQTSGGTASAAWTVSGLIRRETNAASTTLVASTVTVISNVPGWTLALTADTINGGLTVTATGAAGINAQWTATIDTTETTYP